MEATHIKMEKLKAQTVHPETENKKKKIEKHG